MYYEFVYSLYYILQNCDILMKYENFVTIKCKLRKMYEMFRIIAISNEFLSLFRKCSFINLYNVYLTSFYYFKNKRNCIISSLP